MIYTTNWIEWLQKDFHRVTTMRGMMPNEESVILLMGKTAMDKIIPDAGAQNRS